MHMTWNLLLVTFSTFTVLCNYHQYIVQNIWSPQKEALCPLSSHSSVSQLQLLAPINLLFLCMDLPVLDISHKCNHSVTYFTLHKIALLWLALFTCLCVFSSGHSCGISNISTLFSLRQNSTSFYMYII